eukprot:1266321-Amorphochlora_amoeboformis.AAC.3
MISPLSNPLSTRLTVSPSERRAGSSTTMGEPGASTHACSPLRQPAVNLQNCFSSSTFHSLEPIDPDLVLSALGVPEGEMDRLKSNNLRPPPKKFGYHIPVQTPRQAKSPDRYPWEYRSGDKRIPIASLPRNGYTSLRPSMQPPPKVASWQKKIGTNVASELARKSAESQERPRETKTKSPIRPKRARTGFNFFQVGYAC